MTLALRCKLAIHGGRPVRTTPFPVGRKHDLAEWRAIKPIFDRGAIQMARGPEVMALREKFKKLFGERLIGKMPDNPETALPGKGVNYLLLGYDSHAPENFPKTLAASFLQIQRPFKGFIGYDPSFRQDSAYFLS